MSKRTRIPEKIASELLFRSGRKCCLCKKNVGKNIQLHHIDGDPSNNEQANLIPLCLNCHSNVQTMSSMGRNYSADELKRHRVGCLGRNNGKIAIPIIKQLSNKHSNELLSLLAIHEIRRIRYKVEFEQNKIEIEKRDWAQIENYMWQLLPFGREYYEYSVRSEIISAASRASDGARYGIKANTVYAITEVLMESVPIYHVIYPAKRKISKKDMNLIERALEVGRGLLWDSCRYQRQQDITEIIMQFMHFILKFAHVNSINKIKTAALDILKICEEICDEGKNTPKFPKIFPQGKKIIIKYRELALEPL